MTRCYYIIEANKIKIGEMVINALKLGMQDWTVNKTFFVLVGSQFGKHFQRSLTIAIYKTNT